MSQRRVVVTGLGMVSPLGVGNDANWEALVSGTSGIAPITRFDTADFATKIAGEVKDFDSTRWFSKKYQRQMDRFIQYAVAASYMAIEDAGIADAWPEERHRAGVYVGAGFGGLTTIEESCQALKDKGPRRAISPYFYPKTYINLAAGQISIFHGLTGPCLGHVSACSTGAHAIGEATRLIQRGDTDVMITGGAESTVTPLGIGGFNASRALSTRNAEPETACRPFSASRDGFILSEGAGLLILEEYERAQARGARIYAEVVGFAATSDAHHITMPAPEHRGAKRCMTLAMADAGVSGEAIGYINAHGTSTAADVMESQAIAAVFGAHARRDLVISSTKSMHGHLLGAAGGLEAAITCQSLAAGVIPPTINLHDPDPACDLDYCAHEARSKQVEYALSNSFGFGGTNASLIFRRI